MVSLPPSLMSKNYLLSVLVPAYNYPEGIARILAMLPFSETQDFECIIFDNSTNDQVANFVQSQYGHYSNFRIQQFFPSTTAVKNWNNLLNSATGKYVMVLHHDEFFASRDSFQDLLGYLRDKSPDVVLLNLRKYHVKHSLSHLHLPYCLRAFLLKHVPSYLLQHNFVGPTATLVVKRTLVKHFDPKLKWLIDVAWYLVVVDSNCSISLLPNVCILSGVDDHFSLTKSLHGEISQLVQSETAYLRDLYSSESRVSFTRLKLFYFRHVDRPIWLLLRVLMLPWVLCSLRRYKDPLQK